MAENNNLLGPWIRRFLLDYLPVEKNLARNTQKSYRDTLTQLLPFSAERSRKRIDRLEVHDLSSASVLGFLSHIEEQRQCSIATRNQRLAAIHSLANFIAIRSPEFIAWCGELRTISVKKGPRPAICYLEKAEMDALLAAPDVGSSQGQRDFAALLFLYNAGTRADEVAQLRIGELTLASGNQPSLVLIHGKGNKDRRCPLWDRTVDALRPLISSRCETEHVFLNRRGHPFTRFGVNSLVKRNAAKAAQSMPSLLKKRVTTHVIRHTTATHLLRSGVDINTIRAWLGHASIATTNVYAEVDLEMKAKALAACEITVPVKSEKSWQDKPDLMEFLRSL